MWSDFFYVKVRGEVRGAYDTYEKAWAMLCLLAGVEGHLSLPASFKVETYPAYRRTGQ